MTGCDVVDVRQRASQPTTSVRYTHAPYAPLRGVSVTTPPSTTLSHWRHNPYPPIAAFASPEDDAAIAGYKNGADESTEMRRSNGDEEEAIVDRWSDDDGEDGGGLSQWAVSCGSLTTTNNNSLWSAPSVEYLTAQGGQQDWSLQCTPEESPPPSVADESSNGRTFPLPKPRSHVKKEGAKGTGNVGVTEPKVILHVRINEHHVAEVLLTANLLDPQHLNHEVVVFEGDRGVDMGEVTAVRPIRYADARTMPTMPKFLRVATPSECETLTRIRTEDLEILDRLRTLAKEVRFPPSVIEAVAMQADRQRLTVYLRRRSKQALDFRKLQRVAFREFHCRIWFVYTDEL